MKADPTSAMPNANRSRFALTFSRLRVAILRFVVVQLPAGLNDHRDDSGHQRPQRADRFRSVLLDSELLQQSSQSVGEQNQYQTTCGSHNERRRVRIAEIYKRASNQLKWIIAAFHRNANPACGGSPASIAYAIACGTSMFATIKPAIRSPTN